MTTTTTTSTSCVACAQPLEQGAAFCIHCGAAQTATTPPVAPDHGAMMHAAPVYCPNCRDGLLLNSERVYCSHCRRLHPLGEGYEMDPGAFMWELDGAAMAKLRSIDALNSLACNVTESVGRPWFEASVNGIRLSEQQLPDIFAMAIRAARIMGVPVLPEIYISGENMWDAVTMGSETSAFIALGSVLANMRGEDMLFVLAREMGHVRAGHALWRTVVELAAGKQGPHSVMGGGMLQFLNPAKILQSAIQAPLLAWKRHSEITADRAAILAVGKEEVTTRCLMQWSLKSFPLYNRINQDAWRQQELDSEHDSAMRLSEWTMSSTPYLANRLRLARDFMASAEFRGWRDVIEYHASDLVDFEPSKPTKTNKAPQDSVRLKCAACQKKMVLPRTLLEGGKPVNVRCPQSNCRKVMSIRPRQPKQPGAESMTFDGTD